VAAQMSQTFGAVTRASVLLLLPPLLPSEWAVRARCDSALPQLDFAGAGAHRWPTTSQQAAVSSGESSDPRRGRRAHRGCDVMRRAA
jgi:hypothetical protein